MNFTASLYRREDRNWGSLMPDGSINGMISSLVKGEADLVATSLTMKPYRHQGCDFLVHANKVLSSCFVTLCLTFQRVNSEKKVIELTCENKHSYPQKTLIDLLT